MIKMLNREQLDEIRQRPSDTKCHTLNHQQHYYLIKRTEQ